MDRRDFIKTAAIGSVVTSTVGGAQIPRSAVAAEVLPVNVATAEFKSRIDALAQKFDFRTYIDLLKDVAPPEVRETEVVLAAAGIGSDSPIDEVLIPIDSGATKFLSKYENSRLEYNPFQVEYLLRSADTFLSECKQLREQAQQIETLWLSSRAAVLLEREAQTYMRLLTGLGLQNDKNLLASMYSPILKDNQASSSSTEYYKQKYELEKKYIDALQIITDAKIEQYRLPGGGSNWEHRHSLIKNSFERALTEAYIRALAASFGLKSVYGVTLDPMFPPLEDVGYTTKLSNWVASALVALERVQNKRSVSTLLLPLRGAVAVGDQAKNWGIMDDQAYIASRNTGTFAFALNADHFKVLSKQLTNVRLRGLEVFAWVDPLISTSEPRKVRNADYYRFLVRFPQEKITNGDSQVWTSNQDIVIPLASFPEGEIRLGPRLEVLNLNPIGDWSISTDPVSVLGREIKTGEEVLQNVLLALSVSHDAL
jgi:hypothetical protein